MKIPETRYVLLIAIAAALLRIPAAIQGYWNPDEPSWMALGQAISDGHVLYRDVVDQIPPLTVYVYAMLQRVFGDGNYFAIALFGAVCVAVTCWAVGRLAFKTNGTAAGVLASTLYAVYSVTFDPDDFLAVNGETIANSLIAIAALSILHTPESAAQRRRITRLLLAGALLALAASAKTQAGTCLFAFIVWKLFERKAQALADVAWMLLGAFSVAFGWYVQIVSNGSAGDAFHLIFEHQFNFAQVAGLPPGYLVLKFGWQWLKIALCGLPLWMFGLSGMFRVFCRRDRRPEMLLGFFWFLFAMFLVPAGGRVFGHYFLLAYPPLALVAGIEAARLVRFKKLNQYAIIFAALYTLGSLVGWMSGAVSGSGNLTRFPQESRYLEEHSPPGSPVFIWGYAPQIYIDANKQSWPAFYSNNFLVGAGFGSQGLLIRSGGAWERFMEDFRSTRNLVRPFRSDLICERAWDKFLREWDENPPMTLIDTSPSGYNRMRYPVSDYPRLLERLAGWTGPVRVGSMDFWFAPPEE